MGQEELAREQLPCAVCDMLTSDFGFASAKMLKKKRKKKVRNEMKYKLPDENAAS